MKSQKPVICSTLCTDELDLIQIFQEQSRADFRTEALKHYGWQTKMLHFVQYSTRFLGKIQPKVHFKCIIFPLFG